MFGLTVRWSLAHPPAGRGAEEVAQALREYVVGTSLARFEKLPGLSFKTWRMRSGEWFEGCYVFETADARDAFEAGFREQAPSAPGTKLIGSPPVLIEACEIVAVAEGPAGFASGAGPVLGAEAPGAEAPGAEELA
jgi:hypothetical protein